MEETEPQVVVQVEGVLAVNCWVAFSLSVAEVGLMVTARAGMETKTQKDTTRQTRGKGPINHQLGEVARRLRKNGLSIGEVNVSGREWLPKS